RAGHGDPDRLAAAPARVAGARVHERLTGQPRAGLGHQALDPLQQPGEVVVAQLIDGTPRVDALDPEALTGPHRADPGEIALVEQARADESVDAAEVPDAQMADGHLEVPVSTEDVGAEVSDE